MPKAPLAWPKVTEERRMSSLLIRTHGARHVTLCLSRPEVHNALDAPLVSALTNAFSSLPESVRTVLLEGEGPSFCAGADLRGWDASAAKEPVTAESLATLFRSMRGVRAVLVAKIHGVAAAGGAGLAAACDIVLAAHTARFRFPESRLGLVPAVIAPYIERALGAARTRYLFLTAAFLSAQDAYAAGWVQQCVEEAALDETTLQTMHALWRAGPDALAECKWLLDALPGLTPNEQAKRCQQTLEKVRSSAEAHEGIRSFFARDTPQWANDGA